MLRPRESRDLRLISSEITTWPAATLSWAQDVFGNAIATATFEDQASSLIVESASTLELSSMPWPVFPIAARAIQFPFTYSPDERTDLGALLIPQHPDPMGRLSAWATSFVRSNPTDTLALLKDLNAGISGIASYQQREGEGTQSPSIPWTWGAAHAATLPSCSWKRSAPWASARASFPAICSPRPSRVSAAQPMPGRKCSCQAPAGSVSIPPTARQAAST